VARVKLGGPETRDLIGVASLAVAASSLIVAAYWIRWGFTTHAGGHPPGEIVGIIMAIVYTTAISGVGVAVAGGGLLLARRQKTKAALSLTGAIVNGVLVLITGSLWALVVR
jgi:hypothetical protein